MFNFLSPGKYSGELVLTPLELIVHIAQLVSSEVGSIRSCQGRALEALQITIGL